MKSDASALGICLPTCCRQQRSSEGTAADAPPARPERREEEGEEGGEGKRKGWQEGDRGRKKCIMVR